MRSADTRPNLHDDKLIRDDHLHVLHPQASLKELVDRHVHTINDPGVTAEVVRFRSQTTMSLALGNRFGNARWTGVSKGTGRYVTLIASFV